MEELTETDQTTPSPTGKESSWRNFAAFIAIGFLNQIYLSVGLAAAQDILVSSFVPTPVILISATIPYCFVTLLFPSFLQRVGQLSRIVLTVVLFVAGALLFSLAVDVEWRLFGVGVVMVGMAIGEVTFIALTALYEDKAVSCYAFGTGIGYIFGPMYYAGMTTVACISPKLTLLAVVGMPFLLLLAYALMDRRTHAADTPLSNELTSRADISYTPLNGSEEASSPPEQLSLTWRDKLTIVKENSLLLVSFFIGYFAEFLLLNGVVTTLAFSNAPFDPRNHYVFYALAFMTGECVGRSYLWVVASCRPGALTNVAATKRTWIFSVVLCFILVFLCFASWFRFLPSVWIVLALMFLVGLLAGALYVNTYLVAGENHDSLRKEFSRAMLTLSPGAGMATAGFIGLVTEPSLRNHCVETTRAVEYCFTRSMHGWNATTSCLIR